MGLLILPNLSFSKQPPIPVILIRHKCESTNSINSKRLDKDRVDTRSSEFTTRRRFNSSITEHQRSVVIDKLRCHGRTKVTNYDVVMIVIICLALLGRFDRHPRNPLNDDKRVPCKLWYHGTMQIMAMAPSATV